MQINEKDYTKSNLFKNFDKSCSVISLLQSEYILDNYPTLLLSNENNKHHHEKLLKTENKINVKIFIQYNELIEKYINELEYLEKDICNNSLKKLLEFKHDIMILYWIKYINYNNALKYLLKLKLNILSEILKSDISSQIDILTFKTNLSTCQFIYSKIDFDFTGKNREKIDIDLNIITDIITQYKINHDDNILDKIKEIDNKYSIKIIENFSDNETKFNLLYYIKIYIFIIILILILILYII
jgi:energy-converting hydrogenase A subunit M